MSTVRDARPNPDKEGSMRVTVRGYTTKKGKRVKGYTYNTGHKRKASSKRRRRG